MGLLAGIGGIASLIFGLADWLRRRPILIVTDLGRAVVPGSIPLAASFKILGMRQVYVVVATAGMLIVVWRIRNPEARVSSIPGSHVWQDFTSGLRAVTHSPIRRAITGHSATAGFFMGFFASLYVWYAIKYLGLSPVLIGAVIALGGVGNILGSGDGPAHHAPIWSGSNPYWVNLGNGHCQSDDSAGAWFRRGCDGFSNGCAGRRYRVADL
jgi:hypothetical protein